MSYGWKFHINKPLELHGSEQFSTELDFENKSHAESFIEKCLGNIECKKCSGKRIKAKGLIINIRKVYFYKQTKRKTLFGSNKYLDKLDRVVWRIDSSDMMKYIKCLSCKTESYVFPTIHFPCLPLASADQILKMLIKMDQDQVRNFVENEIMNEAKERKFKIRQLLTRAIAKEEKARLNYRPNANQYREVLNALRIVLPIVKIGVSNN